MTRLNSIDRAAEKLAETRHGSEFDERERAVYAESGTFANTLAVLVGLLVALGLATIGHILASVAVLAAIALPEAGAAWYCLRRDVDPSKLRSTQRSRFIAWSVAALSVALFTAWAFPILADRPLLPLAMDPATQPFENRLILWGVLGFVLLLNLWMHLRRRELRRREASSGED